MKCNVYGEATRKGELEMLNPKKTWMMIVITVLITLMATPAFARTISLKDAGVAVWIFVIVGAIIVLLQLIPAAILFFSFIGTTSAAVFGGKKAEERAEEKGVVAGYEPAPVKE
jgi:hypothetical protein